MIIFRKMSSGDTYYKEKSVSVNSESPTNMSILATWNEASSLPGNRIAIDLTESSAFILSTIEDGIELSGDNLNNSEIVVAKDDEVNVVENNTESNDIIIAKDENDKVIVKDNEEHEHTWDEGVITKEATCTEDGEIVYACTSCEETKTEVIKATGHDYHNGVCSKCGDKQASVPVTPVKPVWKSWFEKIIKEWIKHFWR